MKAGLRDGTIDTFEDGYLFEHALYRASHHDGESITIGRAHGDPTKLGWLRRQHFIADTLDGEALTIHDPDDTERREVELDHYKRGKRTADQRRIKDGRVIDLRVFVDGGEVRHDEYDRSGQLETRTTSVNRRTTIAHYIDGKQIGETIQ